MAGLVGAIAIHADNILRGARQTKQRSGQWLFNHLPEGPAEAVRGTLFDPFQKDMTGRELEYWMDHHLIFDGNDIVGVFDGDKILWEA